MQPLKQQFNLFSSAESEAALYHDAGQYGFFSVLTSWEGKKHQKSYRLPFMPEVLKCLPKDQDSWISQCDFDRPNRRLVNLVRIPILFLDIDCYKLGLSPQRALSILLYKCDELGFPHPSIVILSGQGLQVKWFLTKPLPRAALPRWNLAQKALVDLFQHIGADLSARDGSRVLRIIGTLHTKSGNTVAVTHVTHDGGQPAKYDFDYLAEYLLPRTQQECRDTKLKKLAYEEEERQIMEERRVRYEARGKTFKVIQGTKTTRKGKRLSDQQLNWDRLHDIRTLLSLRGGATEQHHDRDMSIFWMLNFMVLSGQTNTATLYHEAAELVKQHVNGEWKDYDQSSWSTLYAKAKDREAGKTVQYQGKDYPPLYTPRNATLIETLQITTDELRHMRTIMTVEESRARDAQRHRDARAAAGAMSREAYLNQNEDKRTTARLMAAQGTTSKRSIARELGIPESTIRVWLNHAG